MKNIVILKLKYFSKIFIKYFSIILLSLQVIADLIWVFSPVFYDNIKFYLDVITGTNFFVSLYFVVFIQLYKFCSISKYAAIAEVLFAIAYMVIQEDNIYNIVFQIIIGVLALLITFKKYVKKFPMCTISLVSKFFKNLMVSSSCTEAIKRFELDVAKETDKKIFNERISKNRATAHYK